MLVCISPEEEINRLINNWDDIPDVVSEYIDSADEADDIEPTEPLRTALAH